MYYYTNDQTVIALITDYYKIQLCLFWYQFKYMSMCMTGN